MKVLSVSLSTINNKTSSSNPVSVSHLFKYPILLSSLFHSSSSSMAFNLLYNSKVIVPNKALSIFNSNERDSKTTFTYTSTVYFRNIRPRPISISFTTTNDTSTTIDDDTNNNNESINFTFSYLINSCGLSKQKAYSVSKKFQLKTTLNPDSVLTLLRNYGFSDTHITKFIGMRPVVLVADPDKTLKPKFDFFNSIGVCGNELAQLLSRHPSIFGRSLEKQIIPSFRFIKSIVHTDTNVIKVLRHGKWVLDTDLKKQLAPNVALLQAHGVPNNNISTLLTAKPNALLNTPDRFGEVVKQVRDMGFDPSKLVFVFAVAILMSMKTSVWEEKLDVLRRWGWSEDDIRMAFMKHPICMSSSKKKITHVMDILVNKMGYEPSLIARHPIILCYSLEKRIFPRSSVLQVLIGKHLIKKDKNISNVFRPNERYFLKKYVTGFESEVPELFSVYLGKVDALELHV